MNRILKKLIFLILTSVLLVGIGVALYLVSLVFNPLLLLFVPVAWFLYIYSKSYIGRKYGLGYKGFYAGRLINGYWKYEEKVDGKLLELSINVVNTEPGHWELIIPNDSEWKSMVPEWARERRKEICDRIIKSWKSEDVIYPNDFEK